MTQEDLECIVIGGGAAGLSTALVLGRARRRILVVDAGEQSNLAAGSIGGLLGSDQRPPAELYAAGRRELEAYPTAGFRADRVDGATATADGFEIRTADGLEARTRLLVLAPGMDYRPPEIAGVAERFGHTAFHCPFCHGWEVSGRRLGVVCKPEEAAERGLMLRAWSDDVTVFTNGAGEVDAGDRARLEAAGVGIEEREIVELRGPGRELESVGLADGSERPLGGLLLQTGLYQRSDLAASLGLELARPNPVVREGLKVDAMNRTSLPGVFGAGDAAVHMPSIQNAIASGAMAGAMVVRELTVERASEPLMA